MNFIISILFFLSSSLTSLLISRHVSPKMTEVFFGLAVLFSIVAFIFAIAAVFCTMNYREEQKQNIIRIKTYNTQIELKKKLIETYKSEVSNSLTKLYPDYEKEMFKTMNPSDAEHLSVFLAKYPELKFNGVLQSFTNQLTTMLHKINELEEYRSATVGSINNMNNNSWFIFKVAVPAGILNI